MVESIFSKLFSSLKPHTNKDEPKQESGFTFAFTPKKSLASDDTKKIDKKLGKDKDLLIGTLISKRYYGKGSDGHYTDKDAIHNSLDEYSGETEVEIPSTAIKDVRYNPKTRVCYVKYTSGNKWYRFINMSPQQFKAFMDSSSKGRYVQFVMRKKNYDPSFKK